MDQAISLDTVIRFLVTTPQLAGLDQAERAEVVRIMEVQRLQDSEAVFREGEIGDAWYVLFEGRAEVVKETGSGSGQRIALLEPGACFGEMAILDGSPRSATVKAVGPLTIFRFRRKEFEELLDDGSLAAYKLVHAMARSLSERQRQLTRQICDLMEREAATGQSARDELGGLVERFQIAQ
jgi:CRP-like cAMP-binding protein